MYNFQKEVVLNDLKSAAIVKAGGTGTSKPNIDTKLRISDVNYFAKYIVDGKIHQTIPVNGVPTQITLKADELAKIPSDAGHIQISIELGLDNDYRGDFGSALYYFRKPIVIDVNTTGLTADSLAKAYKTAIPTDYTFLKVYTADSQMPVGMTAPGANDVLLVAEDSYIKVRSLTVDAYNCANRCEGSSEEPELVAEMLKKEDAQGTVEIKGVDGVKVYGSVLKNNVEFGTYEYLIHNLRLPTYENLRFTSPSAPEMPIKGTAYVQYSFAYCVPRGVHFGGMSVAGQTNHSTTLHTFFVPAVWDSTTGEYKGNEEFEKLFTDADNGLGMGDDAIVPIGRKGKHKITILADSYASSQDLKAKDAIEANTEADKKVKADLDALKAKVDQIKP